MSTISVKDGGGNPVNVNTLPALGSSNAAGSLPVVHATDDLVVVATARPAGLANNQVTVSASATLVVAARAGRSSVSVVNHGTTAAYVGAVGVTATSGVILAGVVGASITLNTSAAIYAITASGSQVVSFAETY